MDDLNVNPNEGTEEVVNPQNEQDNSNVESVNEDVTTSQQSEKPVQSSEDNAKYADIRRKAESDAQQRIDAKYEKEYGQSHNIHSEADYDAAIAQQTKNEQIQEESERTGIDPALLERLQAAEEKLNGYETRDKEKSQAEQLQSVQKEADELIAQAKEEGFEITPQQLKEVIDKTGVSNLKDAYKLLKSDVDIKSLKDNAVKEYIESRRNGRIPVEGSGSTPVVASESPKNFKDARAGALEMLRASKLYK